MACGKDGTCVFKICPDGSELNKENCECVECDSCNPYNPKTKKCEPLCKCTECIVDENVIVNGKPFATCKKCENCGNCELKDPNATIAPDPSDPKNYYCKPIKGLTFPTKYYCRNNGFDLCHEFNFDTCKCEPKVCEPCYECKILCNWGQTGDGGWICTEYDECVDTCGQNECKGKCVKITTNQTEDEPPKYECISLPSCPCGRDYKTCDCGDYCSDCDECTSTGCSSICNFNLCEQCDRGTCKPVCGTDDNKCLLCLDGKCVEKVCDTANCEKCYDGECLSSCNPRCETCSDGKCVPNDNCDCLPLLNNGCGPCKTCSIIGTNAFGSIGKCVDLDCGRCRQCEPIFDENAIFIGNKCVDTCTECEECRAKLNTNPDDPITYECFQKCPSCAECVDGECVNKCPNCQRCDPTTGQCVTNCGPCQICRIDHASNTETCEPCSGCEKCIDQQCIGNQCPKGTKCSDQTTQGKCIFKCEACEKYIESSDSCVPCDNCDNCINDRCVPKICDACYECDLLDGGCKPKTCPSCNKCDTQTNSCIPCGPCEVCDSNGKCVPKICPNPCEQCIEGECVGCNRNITSPEDCRGCDPTTNQCIKCPPCTRCNGISCVPLECGACYYCDDKIDNCVKLCPNPTTECFYRSEFGFYDCAPCEALPGCGRFDHELNKCVFGQCDKCQECIDGRCINKSCGDVCNNCDPNTGICTKCPSCTVCDPLSRQCRYAIAYSGGVGPIYGDSCPCGGTCDVVRNMCGPPNCPPCHACGYDPITGQQFCYNLCDNGFYCEPYTGNNFFGDANTFYGGTCLPIPEGDGD